jgi:plasmid segregation protein ParM
MKIGVDLGTYEVKTSEEKRFLSQISESPKFNEVNRIEIDDKVYYVGEGDFSTDWDKSLKENTIPLLYAALVKSSSESVFQVVAGLPIQQYKANKDMLKKFIEENRIRIVTYKNVKRKVVISDFEVAPEGASTYYNLSKEIREKINKKPLIIVDIGGRTSDICYFQDKVIKDVKTIKVGMLDIYEDIIDYANSNFPSESEGLVLEDGEDILKNGLFLKGVMKDNSFLRGILKTHFDKIYKDLQLKFPIAKGFVYLTGGGSINFRQAFLNRLPNNTIFSNDPIFDNAKGYKKLADSLFKDKNYLIRNEG